MTLSHDPIRPRAGAWPAIAEVDATADTPDGRTVHLAAPSALELLAAKASGKVTS